MGLEVLCAQAKSNVSFLLLQDWYSQLLLQHLVCVHAAMLPTMAIKDYSSETVSQPQLNGLF